MISDIQILTAAHCVVGKTTDQIGVIIGNQNAGQELTKFNFHYVFKIEIYDSYNQQLSEMKAIQQNSDVAVLTLEEPVLLNTKVMPICLPSISDTDNTYEGVTGTVAGWGITEDGEESVGQLLTVDVPIISNTECRKSYKWLKRFFCSILCDTGHVSVNCILVCTFALMRKGQKRTLQGGLRWTSVHQG